MPPLPHTYTDLGLAPLPDDRVELSHTQSCSGARVMTAVVRLDRRVVHHEKNKMYDSIVVASPRHKVYDHLVGVSWAVEPGL